MAESYQSLLRPYIDKKWQRSKIESIVTNSWFGLHEEILKEG